MKNLSNEIIYNDIINFYNLHKKHIIYLLKQKNECKLNINNISYKLNFLYIDKLNILFVKSFEKMDNFYYLDNDIYVIKYIDRKLNINNIMNFVI